MKLNTSVVIRSTGQRRMAVFGLLLIARALALALFAYVLTLMSNENLPDYDSYLSLFTISSELEGRYAGFAQVLGALKDLGLTYENFRLLVMVLGIVLSMLLLRFQPEGAGNANSFSVSLGNSSLLLLFFIFVFIFEFFAVRLRAGISIFFFSIGFLPLLNGYRFRLTNAFRSMAILLCFIMSAVIHFETFGVLVAFLFPPLLWKRAAKVRGYRKSTHYALICIFVWLVFFWQGVSGSTSFRGENLASDLNSVRFLAISILPILLWVPVWAYYKKISVQAWRSIDYPYLFALNYVACAIAIILFYYSGAGRDDGEAIVRVVTLSSVGAALCLSGWGTNLRNAVPIYLISSNSLFFINTLFF